MKHTSREKLLAWAERFPKEFYQELFRLKGWQFDPMSVKCPRMVGKLTKVLIYKKLPPGVLEELERKNPPVYEKDYRKYKHHQYLTPDIGNVHLEKQVASVTTLMRISKDWTVFEHHFNKAFPPKDKAGKPTAGRTRRGRGLNSEPPLIYQESDK